MDVILCKNPWNLFNKVYPRTARSIQNVWLSVCLLLPKNCILCYLSLSYVKLLYMVLLFFFNVVVVFMRGVKCVEVSAEKSSYL